MRFRLVLLDDGQGKRLAYRLVPDSHGQTWFAQWEGGSWIPVSLEAVERRHLPQQYQHPELRVTLGPVQEVAGVTEREAFDQVLAVVRALETSGEFGAPSPPAGSA